MSANHFKKTMYAAFTVMCVSLFAIHNAQADDAAKPAAQSAKPAKAVKGKKTETKKNAQAAGAGSCEVNSKRWADGKHCVSKCDEKNTMCDMRICVKGEWKPYSSCFGSAAVSPNCPPACS